jgi:tetratricopeptide (TPR) repeat protein
MTILSNFFGELRRRNVFRAGIAYAVSVWLVVEVADVLLPVFDAPDWTMKVLVAALALGFPVALSFSWFFEITADGIKRTEDVLPDNSAVPLFDRRMTFIIIAMLVAGLSLSLYGNFRSPDAPHEFVSILIADFDNKTGNDVFSGVLEDFLLVGLEVAPFVNAYSRKEATAIAANLPGADQEAPSLDRKTAALIALRQGVNIVIAGNVSRSNDKLAISVTAISAGSQQELFSVTENAAADTDILNAIAAISKKLRIKLGNTEKPGGAGESESFAVTNLEAAAEYLKAQDLQFDRKLEEAVPHYEKALLLDPDFARAYAGLALTEQYLGNSDAATENWKAAMSRLNRLTERGRLRTLGSYFLINQHNYEKALETYESLVEKYPADNVAQNNLAVTAFYAMDFGRALEVGRVVARRFPHHGGYGANLALYAMYASRFDEASKVAQKLIDDDLSSAYALLVLALTSAVEGNFAAAENAYQRMTELDQFGNSIATEGLADLAVYRGEFDQAIAILDGAIKEELSQNASHTAALKQVMRAETLLRNDERGLAQDAVAMALKSSGGDPAVLVPAAITLIQLGETDQADAIATELSESLARVSRAYASIIRARLAAVGGEPKIAIEFANTAVDTVDLWLIRFIRAQILQQAGHTAEAAADLQVCQQRIGEGLAVFLNDRPSFRLMRDFEAAVESSNASDVATASGL